VKDWEVLAFRYRICAYSVKHCPYYILELRSKNKSTKTGNWRRLIWPYRAKQRKWCSELKPPQVSDDGSIDIYWMGKRYGLQTEVYRRIHSVCKKIDGDKFTAFIVEKKTALLMEPRDIRWELKISSTVQLFFQDCKVPAENVGRNWQRSYLIAFNILNIGRRKLVCGNCWRVKRVLNIRFNMQLQREQLNNRFFGQCNINLLKWHCLWAAESTLYHYG